MILNRFSHDLGHPLIGLEAQARAPCHPSERLIEHLQRLPQPGNSCELIERAARWFAYAGLKRRHFTGQMN